ncbi:helix-turn-helix transcriptional regulator [Microbacterium sp. RD1]|uniref:helix-turn-helix transcriptional regulator n=1 Tax=Microbacterium sp. RD1 TaxID=3457313 RepID=UPI003FA5A12D
MANPSAPASAGALGASPLLLPRPVRNHLDALSREPAAPRVLVVGPAGSGRSRVLREIARRLGRDGRPVVTADAAATVDAAPAEAVVLADDVHTSAGELIAALARRVQTPGAGVVVASAPWPLPDPVRELATSLEKAHPPLVLGHVTRVDVLDACAGSGRFWAPRCIDDILELAGHLAWLVGEALVVHEQDCEDESGHPALREELRDLIAHRIASLEPPLLAAIETLCLSPGTLPLDEDAHWALAGHARGLLMRNGHPAPVVRDAVRATISVDRLFELYATPGRLPPDAEMRRLLSGFSDPRLATALLLDGDAALGRDPRRADELFRAAGEAGADGLAVATRRARAAWNAGEVDTAGAILDRAAVGPAHPSFPTATAITGAVWAARADLPMSSAVFTRADVPSPDLVAAGTIAAVGAGDAERLVELDAAPPARALPSTLVVAQELLVRGLRTTLGTRVPTCLSDLVRATEMYTASGCDAPVPEIPAVLATVAALSLGDLHVAANVISDAVRSRHGGAWAQQRLLLWQAWVAVQRERPHDAEAALRAAGVATTTPARERVLADAVAIALTRRYADPSALPPVWRRARESILRARFDVYSLIPLAEFAVSAARLGDMDRVQPHLDDAAAALARLGDPPVWSSHLHWAGLHCSIHLNRPHDLRPHARALLSAAPHTRLAATMAQAGRVWTEVLTGKVDVDAIEHAALGLASVGLAWDGARLAGHGAGRTDDRRAIARLLACARHLHPREVLDPPVGPVPEAGPSARGAEVLSAREREVAALVVQGKTYAEIGESIFISPRTAEHHIARIRRRLEATSRSDLIAKLRLVLEDATIPGDLRPSRRVERA